MDLGNIFQSVVACPVAQVGVYVFWFLLADLILALAAQKVLNYFCGWQVADRTLRIIAFPVITTCSALVKIWTFLRSPWTYRERRLLREDFEIIDTSWEARELNQKKVDKHLGFLARSFKASCDRQEEARRGSDVKKIREANWDVAYSKRQFWSAYHLVRKCVKGVYLRKSHLDYLNCY